LGWLGDGSISSSGNTIGGGGVGGIFVGDGCNCSNTSSGCGVCNNSSSRCGGEYGVVVVLVVAVVIIVIVVEVVVVVVVVLVVMVVLVV